MKNFMLIVAMLSPVLLTSQRTVTWKGGQPGMETSWTEPANWSDHRVPGESDRVVIALSDNGHYAQPVIRGEVTVAWIEIQGGASLTITETGQLIVDGSGTYSEGITMYGGTLRSNGTIVLVDIQNSFMESLAATYPKVSMTIAKN